MTKMRITLDDCKKEKKRLDPLPKADSYYTEENFKQMALARGFKECVKFPDCGWHNTDCRYVVVELKSSNFNRALRQLECFAEYFPEIHEKVDRYIVVLEDASQLKGIRCKSAGRFCEPYRVLRKHQVQIKVRGKPVYIYLRRG